ncbi:hypothetical protein DFJ73DRAFT_328711 [Zopfochytrium polystomum]|nr:hypothetical protein DFJ73DRAFT_328711 [Zopfochytrium polystomum]
MPPANPLNDILNGNVDTYLRIRRANGSGGGGDSPMRDVSDSDDEDDDPEAAAPDADHPMQQQQQPAGAAVFCIDCEDQPASLFCDTCGDPFCRVCFDAIHRKGSRRSHVVRGFRGGAGASAAGQGDGEGAAAVVGNGPGKRVRRGRDADDDDEDETENGEDADFAVEQDAAAAAAAAPEFRMLGTDAAASLLTTTSSQPTDPGDYFLTRAQYIPVRLTLSERKLLRLLEAALNVSEYTDKIDVLTYGSKTRRQVAQIQELCSVISGLVLAADYKEGQVLFKERSFEDNEEFFQTIFELGRRHKIMNPEKMRSTYGKLIYLLQDSQIPEVKDLLQFSCVKDIVTVHRVLEAGNALDVLRDPMIVPATMEILSEGRPRREVQMDIKRKERAIETLAKKYSNSQISDERVKQCLYSIGDNHAFLRVNRDPCDKMIGYLKTYFSPDKPESPKFSLAIQGGRGGARLSHDHQKQYNYVLQSLTLWREIMHDMFMLWGFAESDLLNEDNYYRLRDTGQGLNRMQAAPKTSRLMHTILHRAQKKVGYWVGSSVIHMGDVNVPNALMFIDKYTQIFRILLPIVRCLESLDALAAPANAGLQRYFNDTFGGVEALRKTILTDFFRHGFDGSGADNFFSAGSCIDGRLTSAWNWCSNIEKKEYFHAFLLSGFVGFDGEWGQ